MLKKTSGGGGSSQPPPLRTGRVTNILNSNDRLYKLGIVQNPLCSLCKQEKATVKTKISTAHISKTNFSKIPSKPLSGPQNLARGQLVSAFQLTLKSMSCY